MIFVSGSNFWYTKLFPNLSQLIFLYALITLHIPLVLGTIDEVKKVHFKIHVPEIINHHIHTKMVFIHEDGGNEHVDEPAPQHHVHPYDEETYSEQWSSWNNNGHIGGRHRSKLHKYNNIDGHDHPPPPSPVHPENGVYMTDGEGEEIVGFTYPPQYAEEVPHNNIETYMENTYRHGLHSESGHLITNNQDNFYDVNQDEADLTDHDYYHEEHDNHNRHSHHMYDKEIGHEDRIGMPTSHRKYFIIRMIPKMKNMIYHV